jgi:hypothetical protein
VKSGRFAGSVGSQQAYDLSSINSQMYVFYDLSSINSQMYVFYDPAALEGLAKTNCGKALHWGSSRHAVTSKRG